MPHWNRNRRLCSEVLCLYHPCPGQDLEADLSAGVTSGESGSRGKPLDPSLLHNQRRKALTVEHDPPFHFFRVFEEASRLTKNGNRQVSYTHLGLALSLKKVICLGRSGMN
jgi:hypothetical protein